MIASKNQLLSNSMSSGKYNRYHYYVAQYRKTIPIQGIGTNTKNGTDTGDQYEYRKPI